MGEFMKSNGFSIAAVVQIVLIVLSATVIFTTVQADVGYLKEAMDKKANADLVDSRFGNIESNIALIQQDIRQIRVDLRDLVK